MNLITRLLLIAAVGVILSIAANAYFGG